MTRKATQYDTLLAEVTDDLIDALLAGDEPATPAAPSPAAPRRDLAALQELYLRLRANPPTRGSRRMH